MNPRVVAILILLGVLVVLRMISPSNVQVTWGNWFRNLVGGSPPTQTTGFDISIPSNVSENTPLVSSSTPTNRSSTPGNGGTVTNGGTGGTATTRNRTSSQPLEPIPGGW